jgi:ribosomal-protein-alanine N-acetyltransferase
VVLRDLKSRDAPGRGVHAYCAVQWAADELHVLNLAVDGPDRRRGVGRWLLAQALRVGMRNGAHHAFLEVRRGNQGAIALYRGLGFTLQQTRRAYYSRPREDALVLGREGLALHAPRPRWPPEPVPDP